MVADFRDEESKVVRFDHIDNGNELDWGKTSQDYATFRPGFPSGLFSRLHALGVGLASQRILDVGTGTGDLARQFARQGCDVVGTDISPGQIAIATDLARKEHLSIEFRSEASENLVFDANSFDIVSAGNCFIYFDKSRLIPFLKKTLRGGGALVICTFIYLPLQDSIAKMTEDLILKYNPDWTSHGYAGEPDPVPKGLEDDFQMKGFFFFDEDVPFTRESWRGRMRTCRAVGPSLSPDALERFDQEHDKLLKMKFGDSFSILHRVLAHILIPKI